MLFNLTVNFIDASDVIIIVKSVFSTLNQLILHSSKVFLNLVLRVFIEVFSNKHKVLV